MEEQRLRGREGEKESGREKEIERGGDIDKKRE